MRRGEKQCAMQLIWKGCYLKEGLQWAKARLDAGCHLHSLTVRTIDALQPRVAKASIWQKVDRSPRPDLSSKAEASCPLLLVHGDACIVMGMVYLANP